MPAPAHHSWKSINYAIVEGHVSNEPELRDGGERKPVLTFDVALGSGCEVSFVDCVVFGTYAVTLYDRIFKGMHVVVEGRLHTYKTKQGSKRTELVVTRTVCSYDPPDSGTEELTDEEGAPYPIDSQEPQPNDGWDWA
jgi:single-stranded DNA-binding protein